MPLNERLKVPNIVDMIKSIRTIRHEWPLKSPFQKWCYFYGIGRAAFTLNGFPLFRNSRSLHWYTYYPIAYIGVHVILVLYTAYYYVIIRGEFTKFLPCTCMTGILLATLPFVLSMLSKNRYKYQSFVDFAGHRLYADNNRKDDEYNEICSKQLGISVKRFSIKYIFLVISAIAAISGPFYVYFTNGILTSTTDLRVPFTEAGSNAEFIINMIFQFNIFLHGSTMYIGIEVLVSILENLMTLLPKLVKFGLRKLSVKLSANQKSKEFSGHQVRVYFTNIVKQVLDSENYIASIKEFFYWRNFMTPSLFTCAIAVSFYSQYTMSFAAGYGLAVMSYVQLFFICELGDRTENNGFADILYESDWYTLPLKQQKLLLSLIHHKQHGQKLMIGPFGRTINRQLFKQITNNIYSIVMFLMNFIK